MVKFRFQDLRIWQLLIKIADEVYKITEVYLKETERYNATSLIIIGGWIEAMYIATNIFIESGKDIGILDKIAEQKYSLEDLLTLLNQNKDDESISEYIFILSELRKPFNELNIDQDKPERSYKDIELLLTKISEIRKDIIY